MKNLIYILTIILTTLIISSCTPQKRLSRLIALHPELIIADTIRINDTIITTQIRIDTSFHHSTLKDTIKIKKEKLRLEIVEIFDTIYIQAQCDPDTIILERVIPVEKIQNPNSNYQGEQKSKIDDFLERWWVWAVFGVFCTFVIIGVYFITEIRR